MIDDSPPHAGRHVCGLYHTKIADFNNNPTNRHRFFPHLNPCPAGVNETTRKNLNHGGRGENRQTSITNPEGPPVSPGSDLPPVAYGLSLHPHAAHPSVPPGRETPGPKDRNGRCAECPPSSPGDGQAHGAARLLSGKTLREDAERPGRTPVVPPGQALRCRVLFPVLPAGKGLSCKAVW
jgi:hypothetical protein